MAHKGQTGTSLGGGIVGRKQLKAQRQPEWRPVDPATLTPEARARRDAYEQEQRERAAATERQQANATQRRRREAEQLAARGLRAMGAASAVARQATTGTSDAAREAAATQQKRQVRKAAKKAAGESGKKITKLQPEGLLLPGQPPRPLGRQPRDQRGLPKTNRRTSSRENGL
ncbi:hypothetical protein [Kineococcus sp. SYSU DK006]|uniref:hypothetical protein n=1 Tax=Kineococcus sp. SYSU DK006 TaxID=3383127 RepID=UPI003D7E38BD